MNFKDIQNIENLVSSPDNSINSNQSMILEDYMAKENRKLKAKENPFIYFYEDVLGESIIISFKDILGEHSFKNASNDALSCFINCDEFRKLSAWSVNGWLQNALKFADHLVLHYIQDVLKEIPKKYSNAGVEKSRYLHISECEGKISEAGYKLKDLYDIRSGMEHRTKVYDDGRQELMAPQRNKIRQIVARLYPDVLRRFMKEYKKLEVLKGNK